MGKQKEGLIRLIVGLVLNVPLYFVVHQLALWSSSEREFRLNLIGICLAAPILVFVLPIFWRGAPWHAPLALLLLVLPGFMLVSVFLFIHKYL